MQNVFVSLQKCSVLHSEFFRVVCQHLPSPCFLRNLFQIPTWLVFWSKSASYCQQLEEHIKASSNWSGNLNNFRKMDFVVRIIFKVLLQGKVITVSHPLCRNGTRQTFRNPFSTLAALWYRYVHYKNISKAVLMNHLSKFGTAFLRHETMHWELSCIFLLVGYLADINPSVVFTYHVL